MKRIPKFKETKIKVSDLKKGNIVKFSKYGQHYEYVGFEVVNAVRWKYHYEFKTLDGTSYKYFDEYPNDIDCILLTPNREMTTGLLESLEKNYVDRIKNAYVGEIPEGHDKDVETIIDFIVRDCYMCGYNDARKTVLNMVYKWLETEGTKYESRAGYCMAQDLKKHMEE